MQTTTLAVDTARVVMATVGTEAAATVLDSSGPLLYTGCIQRRRSVRALRACMPMYRGRAVRDNKDVQQQGAFVVHFLPAPCWQQLT